MLAECVLSRRGAQVVCVNDGSACIAVFRRQRFDVVFMDRLMPVMSGPQATAAIRRIEAEEGRQRTPIIAVTACAFRREIDEFVQAGVDDVLVKPYRLEDLDAVLRKWSPCT